MRKVMLIAIAALAIGIAIIYVLRPQSGKKENITAISQVSPIGTVATTSASAPAARAVPVDSDNSPNNSRLRELHAKLRRLETCGTAQAALDAKRNTIKAECMGQPDQQKCLAEGETALDKVPIYASYKKDFARCGGINNLSTELYLASRAVAEAGDVDVQVCFAVGFGRQDEDTGISGIGDYDADYRSLARQYIDAAFARGDWRIVQRFTRTQLFMGDGGIASVYPHGTMDMAYKMTRLLQMGATGSYADELAARLEAMKGDPRLTEQQIKEGDDWANATYAQYFAHASRLTKEPADLCG